MLCGLRVSDIRGVRVAKHFLTSPKSTLGLLAYFTAAGTDPSAAQTRSDLPQIQITEPASGERASATTPLNTGIVADNASKLGLTPRETPATVEIIDKKMIEDRGYR